MISKLSNFIEGLLAKAFYNLGYKIGLHPCAFILSSSIIFLSFCSGFYWLNVVGDPEYLYTPVSSQAKQDRAIIERLFHSNTSENFDAGRLIKMEYFGRAIITAKDGGSVLREIIFNEAVKLDEVIQNISATYQEEDFKYHDLCAKGNSKCFENNILDLATKIPYFEKGSFKMKYPIMYREKTLTIYFLPAFLGGVKIDEDGFIISAKALALVYFLDYDAHDGIPKSKLWEEAFLNDISKWDFEFISVAKFTSRSLEQEINNTVYVLIPYFVITILIMVVFAEIACSMVDWVLAKPWLGAFGCLSALLGVGSAFGFCLLIGVPCVAINIAIIFIMIGIGMDDMFVLFGAWRQSNPSKSIPERVAQTYQHAGASITITSLTNFLSFIIGLFTPFPVTYIFCTYAALSVLFCYLCHITFFGGFLTLFGHLENAGRHSFFLVKIKPKSLSTKKNFLYRILLTGGKNPEDPDNPLDNKEHFPMTIFRDYLSSVIINTYGKILIILLFLIYISISIYGVLSLKEGLKERDLFQDDSYANDFFQLHYKHFSRYHMRIQVVIDEPLDYSNETVQLEVEHLLSRMESGPFIAPKVMTESWLRAYKIFLDNGGFWMWYRGYDIRTKKDFIRLMKNAFFKVPGSKRFHPDVVFGENDTDIIASRYLIQSEDMFDITHGVETLLSIRKIAEESPFKTFVYNPIFLFMDHLLLTKSVTIQTLITAILIMLIITLLFIPQVLYALLMAFTIFSVELGVLGFMSLWDVNLDPISMVCLIMCIGFSVDNAAHILCAFITSKESTPEKKVKDSLYYVGLPIIQGFLSSVISIIALLLGESTVFFRVFKIVFLALLFGTLHSLFLLPVFLLLINKCTGKRKKSSDGNSKIKNNLKHVDPKNIESIQKNFEIVERVTSI